DDLARIVDRRLPLVPISDIKVECNTLPPSSTQQESQQQALITFKVDATGESGRLEITFTPPETVELRYILNGKLMWTANGTLTSLSVSRSSEYVIKLLHPSSIDPGAIAIDSLLTREQTVNELALCLNGTPGAMSNSLTTDQNLQPLFSFKKFIKSALK